MKQQAKNKAKSDDTFKRILNLPPTLDLLIAFPLAVYAAYELQSGGGSRMIGFAAIVVAFCFAGLGINAVMRNMREIKILENYGQPGLITSLDEAKFERMLKAFYKTRGYMIEEPGDHLEDPEYDFILVRAKERFLVRTRDWAEDEVPISSLKKLWNAKRPVKANGVIIFTNGVFTNEALDWGKRQNIEMITGKEIEASVLDEVKGTRCEKVINKRKQDEPTQDVIYPHSMQEQESISGTHQPCPTQAQYIFLDFNVLENGIGKLGNVLDKHPDIRIVATTNKECSLEELKQRLPGFGDRLCGKTPVVQEEYGKTSRYYEILQFLANTNDERKASWLAIDTQPNAFPEGCVELVPVSRMSGVDQQTLARIEERLKIVTTP